MVWTLDLGPLVRLQKRMWSIAFSTGLGLYVEALATLVLVTEARLSPAVLPVIVVILIAQLMLIHRPSRQLAQGDLARRHLAFIGLVPVFVAATILGTPASDRRLQVAVFSALLAAIGVWGAARAIRVARAFAPRVGALHDRTVLVDVLTFGAREALNARLRSFGGDRGRWALPFFAAVLTFAVVASTLVFLTDAMGIDVTSAPARPSAIVAVLVFYLVMRWLKPSASQLRESDPRPPVLILRQFGDDFLESGKISATTFEHFIAGELNRIGPVVAIGRPGEKLQPLGASRDYLEGSDWQRAVGAAIMDAALVVLVLGDSESVLWEFRTTIETRGKAHALIVVPPLPDRAELGRRWARFVAASADLLGTRFPRELPERSVLAITFVGDDALIVVNDERPRSRATLVRSRPDYRLLFRLFDSVQHQQLPTAEALDAFLARAMPLVRLTAM